MHPLVKIDRKLTKVVGAMTFQDPVAFCYNPLDYARKSHELYLEKFGSNKKRIVFLGMNPGPFGMAQTGVPFGEIEHVRDWMGIEEKVEKPASEHTKRPILGFDCPRSEVSGRRLWSWAKDRYGSAEDFFADRFALNYCPLVFMEESSRNYVPEKLPETERSLLFAACDRALADKIDVLDPEWVIGIGAFAKKCATRVLGDSRQIGQILHPSPASPAANRGWAEAAEKQLDALGLL